MAARTDYWTIHGITTLHSGLLRSLERNQGAPMGRADNEANACIVTGSKAAYGFLVLFTLENGSSGLPVSA